MDELLEVMISKVVGLFSLLVRGDALCSKVNFNLSLSARRLSNSVLISFVFNSNVFFSFSKSSSWTQ